MLQQSHGIRSNYKLYNVGLHMIKSEVKKIITCQMVVEKLCRGVEPHQAPNEIYGFYCAYTTGKHMEHGQFPHSQKNHPFKSI